MTAESHRQTEAQIDWRAELATRESYVALLAKLYTLAASADAALNRWLGDRIDWLSERRLATLIADDLDDLGTPRPVAAVDCFSWVNSWGAAAGVLYVVEGATLGSQVLARAANESIGVDLSHGARFLNGYGQRTRERWSRTRQWLDDSLTSIDNRSEAILAAIRGFEVHEEILRRGSLAEPTV